MRYASDFISVVKARRAEIATALAEGNAMNIESYHRLVGNYLGLGEALEILNKLLEEPNEHE